MNLAKGSKSQIKSAVSMYGHNMCSLRQVLQVGPTSLESEINRKVCQLGIADLQSLIKLDADYAGNATHGLIESRCPDQPEPGTNAYLLGDVLRSMAAVPAVRKKLLLFSSLDKDKEDKEEEDKRDKDEEGQWAQLKRLCIPFA